MKPEKNEAHSDAAPGKVSVFRVLFYISLLYYVIWFFTCISFAFTGLDSGWLIPSLSSGEKNYGLEAFSDGIGMCLICTFYFFWFIPLYQIIYLIVSGIRKIVRKCRDADKNT